MTRFIISLKYYREKLLFANIKLSILFLLLSVLVVNTNVSYALDHNLIKESKRAVVSIKNNVTKSAYSNTGSKYGTGFLIDKERGIILTNAHIASQQEINNLTVTFFNGKKLDALFIYNDPLIDFAFIKVDPKSIPHKANQLKLSSDDIKLGEEVLMIGNNQGQEFSVQSGIVSSKYRSVGLFPNQTLVISMNTRGGASGSPAINYQGEVVGLIFATDETFSDAIKINYIVDAFEYIKLGTIPPRFDIGAIVDYRPIDDMVKYGNFPIKLSQQYSDQYPEALSNVLVVEKNLKDSPADKFLLPGDVIWKVNGKEIGPRLYELQKIFNKAKSSKVNVEIYRNGKLKQYDLIPYDLNKINQMKRMVVFAGAVFFEADDYARLLFGIPLGSLLTSNIAPGTGFDNLPYLTCERRSDNKCRMINIKTFADRTVKDLDSLINIIPKLVLKKYFTTGFQNYFFTFGFDNAIFLSRSIEEANIEYNEFDQEPTLITFDEKSRKWKSTKILNFYQDFLKR